MVTLIDAKLTKEDLELTKSLFDYSKMFMHSQEQIQLLEG